MLEAIPLLAFGALAIRKTGSTRLLAFIFVALTVFIDVTGTGVLA